MADESVIVCDALCFLRHKFGKTNVKILKSALMDFYDIEVLSAAKCQLLKDTFALNSSIKFPHVPQRRDGDNRLAREIDDVFSIFTLLDENKLIDKLPRYVADGPDSMPSLRLYEGELSGLLMMVKKLTEKLDEYGSVLSIISRDVRDLQVRCASTGLPVSVPSAFVDNAAASTDWPQLPARPSDAAKPKGNATGISTTTLSTRSESTDWAVMASTPVPKSFSNRYASLATMDVECSDTPSADDQFTVVSSRKKRARHRTSPQSAAPTSNAMSAQRDANQPTKRQASMLGKSVSVSVHSKIIAAKQLRKKAVLCIDNVSTECSIDDMKSFVSDMSVSVLSCFEVKPRRRRSDGTDIHDRKAFRLCVFEDDRKRLLDVTKWPNSIVISDWYFKPRDTVTNTNEQTVLKTPVDAADPPAAAAAAPQHQSPGLSAEMDVDNTVLYNIVSDGAGN